MVDTSAWMRAGHPSMLGSWNNALRAGRLRISPVIRLEILFAARDDDNFDAQAIDYLLAATAQEMGAAVLHYDRDYDTLAEVVEFESVWLAPAASLP